MRYTFLNGRCAALLFKICKDCKKSIPLEEMPIQKQSKDGRHICCFPCKRLRQKVYQATYVAKDPERRKAQYDRYANSHKSEASDRSRRQKYGLSNQDVDLIVQGQGGVCKLCRGGFEWGKTFVDHDHSCCPRIGEGVYKTCGKCVRGILCRKCNQGLGFFDDDPENLRRAAKYIENFRNNR